MGKDFQREPKEFQRKVGVLISEFRDRGIKENMAIGEVIAKLLIYSHQHRIHLETNFVNVAVSLAVMDGLGRQLHRDFNIFRSATPHLAKAALRYKARQALGR